ncbi:MAG: ABC transporter substrate-binding protein [Candidatus Caldarchaeales archaeon]
MGVVAGVAGYFAGTSTAPVQTVTQTVAGAERTVTTTITQAITKTVTAELPRGPIKIGTVQNLTGGMAFIDAPALNGINLAAKQWNEQGGVLNREIQILAVDTKTDQAEAAAGAKRLVEQGVSAIIGYGDTTFALAAAPAAQQAKVVFVTQGATHPRLPEFIGDYFFMTPFGDNDQAAAMAEYAVKTLGYKTAVIWVDYAMDFSVAVCSYFLDAFQYWGGKVLYVDRFKTDDTDFSAQISRFLASSPKPDFLYLGSTPGNVGIMVKQIREAGITTPIIGQDGFDTPEGLVGVAKEAAEGIIFTTHVSLFDPDSRVTRFVEAYRKEYGKDPENAFAALGYDALNLILNAISRAGSDRPSDIKAALEKTKNFPGVTGDITLSPERHVPFKSVAILKVEGGKFMPLAKLVSSYTPDPKKDKIILEF